MGDRIPDKAVEAATYVADRLWCNGEEDIGEIVEAALSAALDACPGLVWLTEAELNALLLAADTGIPGLNPVASEDYRVMVALARAGDKLRAALRLVEREGEDG